MDILKKISDIGIVPVIKISDVEKAVPLANALIEGGLPIAEITFRTAEAEEAIKRVSEQCPDMLVGAGTVLTVEQAERAKNAGAKFIVSPGFNPKVVSWCLENGIVPTPGCTSPSEIEQALELGLECVKFFPAEQSGGIAKIKALSAPYGNLKFIPTGGINSNNLSDYIKNRKILACGGSFMVKEEFIENGEWDKIVSLTKEAVKTMLNFKLAHIGINSENEESAVSAAKTMAALLNLPITKESEKSVFTGTDFEFMKKKGPGTMGHIGISTPNVDRAVYHLSKKGIVFDESSAQFNSDNTRKFIYVKDEIAGFAVHFVQA